SDSLLNVPSCSDMYTLSLHDALPIYLGGAGRVRTGCAAGVGTRPDAVGRIPEAGCAKRNDAVPQLRGQGHSPATGLPAQGGQLLDRKSTRLNSSHVKISYAVFCLKKK